MTTDTKKSTKNPAAEKAVAKETAPKKVVAKKEPAKTAGPKKAAAPKELSDSAKLDLAVTKVFASYRGNKRGLSTIFTELQQQSRNKPANEQFKSKPKEVQASIDRLVKKGTLSNFQGKFYQYDI